MTDAPLSLNDLMGFEKEKIRRFVFVNANKFEIENKYYRAKINEFTTESNDEIMITIIDVTDQILCDKIKNYN